MCTCSRTCRSPRMTSQWTYFTFNKLVTWYCWQPPVSDKEIYHILFILFNISHTYFILGFCSVQVVILFWKISFWIYVTNFFGKLFVEKIFSNDAVVMRHVTPESAVGESPINAFPISFYILLHKKWNFQYFHFKLNRHDVHVK